MIMQIKLDSATKSAERIGQAVHSSRISLGLRQEELALAAGVSTRAVHQIEHGKPTSRLDSIAPILDVLGLELIVADRQRPTAKSE